METLQFCIIVMMLYDVLFAVTRQARFMILGYFMVWITIALVILDIYGRLTGGK